MHRQTHGNHYGTLDAQVRAVMTRLRRIKQTRITMSMEALRSIEIVVQRRRVGKHPLAKTLAVLLHPPRRTLAEKHSRLQVHATLNP